jgi:hypothetical protein
MAVAITSGEEPTVRLGSTFWNSRFSAEYWALFAFLLPISLTIGIILKVHCSTMAGGVPARRDAGRDS